MDAKGFKPNDNLHWPTSEPEAVKDQIEMAEQIELFGNFDDLKYIAAVDTAYGKNGEVIYAAAVVVSFPEIEEVEKHFRYDRVTFPYIPGLFYYREGPAILNVLSKLETEPDVIIVHGHGIAHPRRCGIAGQVGLAVGKPTIGCARKLLCGTHRARASPERKSTVYTSEIKRGRLCLSQQGRRKTNLHLPRPSL